MRENRRSTEHLKVMATLVTLQQRAWYRTECPLQCHKVPYPDFWFQ